MSAESTSMRQKTRFRGLSSTSDAKLRRAVSSASKTSPRQWACSTIRCGGGPAHKRGLIHFASPTEGWKCGHYIPKKPPRKDASPLIVATAECVRELANGRPARTVDIAKRLGIKLPATIQRLRFAVASGLIVSVGYRNGWWHADELPEEPSANVKG